MTTITNPTAKRILREAAKDAMEPAMPLDLRYICTNITAHWMWEAIETPMSLTTHILGHIRTNTDCAGVINDAT